MLLCVVGNCLLFYCSCTGNCENCCGINGNASVSGSIKDKSESESEIDIKNKLEEVTISAEGKIDNIQVVNAEFANLVNACLYTGNSEEEYKKAENKFIKEIDKKGETYLSAYVEVKKIDDNVIGYFIHCKNANRKIEANVTCGLFNGSEATKIEILRCGSEIEDMNSMFYDCMSLTKIIFSNKFNTNNVKYMRYMFYNCSSLTNLNLSQFNTDNVTDMFGMFYNCSSLKELDLSNFNTNKVTNMFGMFSYCFQNKATLICKESTLKKITDENEFSNLAITNEKEKEVNNIIGNNNNPEQVYTCSVKKVGSNPEITSVVEYKQQ